MRPHASRRRLRRLLSMRASVVGGILAKRSQWGACLLDPCETDLRLQETIAGSGPIVCGLLFTMNGATRTCDMGLRRSSETRAPRRETLALRSEAKRGEGGPSLKRVHARLSTRYGEGRVRGSFSQRESPSKLRMPRSCPSPASPLRGSAPSPRHSASLRAFTPVFDGLWTRVNALKAGRGKARGTRTYLTTCIARCRCRRRSRSARRTRRRTWRAARHRWRGEARRRRR